MATHPDSVRADRYGEKPRMRPGTARRLAVALGAVAIVLVALLGVQTMLSPSIDVETTGYRHLSATEIQADFQVTKDPDAEVVCTVEALNARRAQVGYLEVQIGASSERITRHRVNVQTTEPAVSVDASGCVAASD